MGSAVRLQRDLDGKSLRVLARASTDADQTRRLLALAEIYDGASRGAAVEIGGVTLQSVGDQILRFNEVSPDGLIDR